MNQGFYRVQVLTCGTWHTYRGGFSDLGSHKNPGSSDGLADSAIHTGAVVARVIRTWDHKIVYECDANHASYL